MAAFVYSPMPFESPYQDVVGQASMLSSLILLFTMLLASRLEKRQLQLEALEGHKWWGSISRDVVNAISAGALFVGVLLQGYSGPDALLLSVGLSAALAGMHAFSQRGMRVEGVLALVWLLFVFCRHVTQRFLEQMKQNLFH